MGKIKLEQMVSPTMWTATSNNGGGVGLFSRWTRPAAMLVPTPTPNKPMFPRQVLATGYAAALMSSVTIASSSSSALPVAPSSPAVAMSPHLLAGFTALQIVGYGLIACVVLFLVLSYTCHMLHVFGSVQVQNTTAYCMRLDKMIQVFSSFNTVRSKLTYNISTPNANKRIAVASHKIALAMSQITGPSSDPNNRQWYRSTDASGANNTKRSSNNTRTIEDFFSTSETEQLMSPNGSFRVPATRKSATDNQHQRIQLSEQPSLFSCTSFVIQETTNSEQQLDVERSKSLDPNVGASIPVTQTNSTNTSGGDQVSVAECHHIMSADDKDKESAASSSRLFLIANSNTSTPIHSPSQEAAGVTPETFPNLGDLAEVDQEEEDDEDSVGPPMVMPSRQACRRTSSLPQMPSFLALPRQDTMRTESMNAFDDDESMSGGTASAYGAGSSTYLLNNNTSNTNDDRGAGSSTRESAQVTTVRLNKQMSQSTDAGASSWAHRDLPGVDNYFKHHGGTMSPKSPPVGTSPLASPSPSVTDVYKLKQQAFLARKATASKRFRRSVRNRPDPEKDPSTTPARHHASFITGHRRLQNLL